MANEIQVLVSLTLNDPAVAGYLKNIRYQPGPVNVTQTNRLLYTDVISCTTADTAFGIGGVGAATQGILILQNLDTTNYVSFGPEVGGTTILPTVKLMPNERNIFRLVPSVVYRRQANTATCKVFVMLLGT